MRVWTLRDKEEKRMNNLIDPTALVQTEKGPTPPDQPVKPTALGLVRVSDLMKVAPSLAALAVGFFATSPLPEIMSSYGGRGH